MHSFSHLEHKRQPRSENNAPQGQNGLDLFARPGEMFGGIEDDKNAPQCVLNAF